MVLNFYGDIVGSDSLRLLKNCVGLLSEPLYAPTNIQLNQHFHLFLRFIGGAILHYPITYLSVDWMLRH